MKENTNRAHEKVDVIMSRPNFGQLWLMELQGVVMIYTQEIRAAGLSLYHTDNILLGQLY